MYNLNKMIILKDIPKDNVISCKYNRDIKKYIITFLHNKKYNYNYNDVQILEDFYSCQVESVRISNKEGKIFDDIEKLLIFKGRYIRYYRILFKNGSYISYNENDLIIEKNMLLDKQISKYMDYYKSVSEVVGLKLDNGNNVLKNQYDKLYFASSDSVLSTFAKGELCPAKACFDETPIIFPFGSNLSQISAVNNAIKNRITIIEGPPGTGKTQTILNILANLIIRDKTVAVVSNNNTATDNVFEKMQKYGFEYIVAQLGNSTNKTNFIDSKQMNYPNFSSDHLNTDELMTIKSTLSKLESALVEMFKKQNRLAVLKQEISSLRTEKQYFSEYFNSTYDNANMFKNENKLSSKKVLKLWIKYQEIIEKNKKLNILFKLKSLLFYDIKDIKIFKEETFNVIAVLKKHFYDVKIKELDEEIHLLNNLLKLFSFKENTSKLTNYSLKLLKHILAVRYESLGERTIFSEDIFFKNPIEFLKQYPIILSTTHSIKSCLKNVTYDYVIVDEASQVDLTTGVLAMSVAKSMVVVGDLMQLPNVINNNQYHLINYISEKANIEYCYRYEKHSLLSSINEVFTSVPKTLLKEHYRCHPKIINFCNQKFYNNKLIIMTADNGEKDVMKATITIKGNHARERFNQRQIDEIKQNILPELNSSSVGIITPYRNQTNALDEVLKEHTDIDVLTVHKFQGREKDDVIISTVDNEISEFTDNPNMLNVAVSRAKNRLRLDVSDNEKNENTNIGDLIKYISYNNFEVKRGDVFSVFDMLYKSYEEERKSYLSKNKKVSEYDSENLMFALISEVLLDIRFSKLDVINHQLLNSIIRDPCKLTQEETVYMMNDLTHVDFLIFNKIDKSIVLVVEVDGYSYHKEGEKQAYRDKLKDSILQKYSIPIIRFSTIGSNEDKRLTNELINIIDSK